MNNKAASVKALTEIKDITKETAQEIRKVWCELTESEVRDLDFRNIHVNDIWRWKTRELRRAYIDQLLQTFGVEYLGKHKRNGEHVYYCNAGDTYTTTIIFMGSRLVVGCWGDLVERNLIRECNQ